MIFIDLMNRSYVAGITLLIVVFSLFGFIPPYSPLEQKEGRINVVVTILPQAEFVEKIGGDKVSVTVMIPAGYSPHAYEPSPAQLMMISTADVYFMLGSGLEFELAWMDRIRKLNRDMMIVNCSEGIQTVGGNPHVWLSPSNAKIMLRNIYNALVELDGKNRELYARNLEAYMEELDELDMEIRSLFENVTGRRFLVYHPAWIYFAMEYNLTQIPIEREGKEPTPALMAAIVDRAKESNLKVIFVSPQFDKRKAEVIAEEIDGKVVIIDPLAKDYVDNLRFVAKKLVEALSENG